MKILIGCEESQAVCIAMRKLGHEAYSCDTQECSGGHPEWHLQMDVFSAIALKNWDMGIFFPPCTFLSKAGACHWKNRKDEQQAALEFVRKLMNCGIGRIAIENPIGKISTAIRKPDQIIEPYHFGHPWLKATCLWLNNLPKLRYTNIVEPTGHWVSAGNIAGREHRRFTGYTEGAGRNKKNRSKTFPGIAQAMADQWGAIKEGQTFGRKILQLEIF